MGVIKTNDPTIGPGLEGSDEDGFPMAEGAYEGVARNPRCWIARYLPQLLAQQPVPAP